MKLRYEVVDDKVAEILRKKTPAEKVQMVCDANRTARILIASSLRSRHPDWDEAEVQAEVARRMLYGVDL